MFWRAREASAKFDFRGAAEAKVVGCDDLLLLQRREADLPA
jgi:hypothetical protein